MTSMSCKPNASGVSPALIVLPSCATSVCAYSRPHCLQINAINARMRDRILYLTRSSLPCASFATRCIRSPYLALSASSCSASLLARSTSFSAFCLATSCWCCCASSWAFSHASVLAARAACWASPRTFRSALPLSLRSLSSLSRRFASSRALCWAAASSAFRRSASLASRTASKYSGSGSTWMTAPSARPARREVFSGASLVPLCMKRTSRCCRRSRRHVRPIMICNLAVLSKATWTSLPSGVFTVR
mmetsp:Transcript_105403/g.308136  ORF Transcript_105403/g.308136 Transcript_105403/m.308136 type:complete len:248 (+) Transcript_105403:303-1046(+)